MEIDWCLLKPQRILWAGDIVSPVTPPRIVPRSAGEHVLGNDSGLHRKPRRVQLSIPNILKALVSDSSRNAALGNGFQAPHASACKAWFLKPKNLGFKTF